MLPGLARLHGYGHVVDVAAVRAADLECGIVAPTIWRRPSLLHGAAMDALNSCISGEGEPPLRLTIAAVACAGSGVICGIPVHQLREDSITELNLSNRGLHVPAAMLVASLIPATSVLKSCNLLKNRFDVELAKKLAKIGAEKGIMLSGMTCDQPEADFTNGGLQPTDAILIASDLQSMAVLTRFYLNGNNIGPEGAIAIAEALKVNAVLTKLDLYLDGNNIGDDGAKAIAEALKVNAVVTKLILFRNNIGNDGAKAIAEALKVNAVLTILHLNYNKIGAEGAIAIAEALKVNAVLTKLWLANNNLGDAGKTAVQDVVKGRSGFQLYP
eukprot:jgi/Chrpa1/8464/Chrysochromulina_OHIO_Genome00015056-RA